MRALRLCAVLPALLAAACGGDPQPMKFPPLLPRSPDGTNPLPPSTQPAGPAPSQPAAPPASEPAAAAAPAEPQAAADVTAYNVKLYFNGIDNALRSPKHGVPAEVKDADALLATLRGRSEQVRQLQVPEPCAAHHAQVLALLDSAMALVDRRRALGATPDQSAQLSFAADRRLLDEQEKQLDALAAEIKQSVAAAAAPPPSPN